MIPSRVEYKLYLAHFKQNHIRFQHSSYLYVYYDFMLRKNEIISSNILY